jgi:F420H(2)-dependent quinone reductase
VTLKPSSRPPFPTDNPAARMFFALNLWSYRVTRGRIGGKLGPFDILLLTTTGRHTGLPRTHPLT